MKKRVRQKGITLVALVVTIIIMLILVGVTLRFALGENGLFKMSEKAVEKYKEQAKEEEDTLGNMEKQLKYIIDGYVPDRSMLKVGDEVNYTPQTDTTTYNLKGDESGYGEYSSSTPNTLITAEDQTIEQQKYTWKVMDINSKTGEVKILGVPTNSMTTVYFRGALGYNNGIYLLDDICKTLYSNSDLGITARSIDIEDIKIKMNNKGKEAIDTYITNSQLIKEFIGSSAYYPTIYKFQQDSNIDGKENTNGISESDDGTKTNAGIPLSHEAKGEGYENAEKINVKGTYYNVEQNEKYYDDQDFYNLIFKTGTYYWLASNYSHCNSYDSFASFGLRRVRNSIIDGDTMFKSHGDYDDSVGRVCPVISIGSNIQITRDRNEEVWELSKDPNFGG